MISVKNNVTKSPLVKIINLYLINFNIISSK